jgi:competence protein ComEC
MASVPPELMSNAVTTTQTYEDLLDAIENNGLSITAAKYGNKYDLDTSSFTILAPISSNYEDLNNYSVVIKLTNGSDSFLFTGDAEEDSEQEMLSYNSSNLSSDVLKVGHHGSNSSTSQSFFNAVNPTYAVISVGKDNTYGHPAQLTIDKLLNRNIKIYRTDMQGTVIATSSGNGITFNTSAAQQNNNSTNIEQKNTGTVTEVPPNICTSFKVSKKMIN